MLDKSRTVHFGHITPRLVPVHHGEAYSILTLRAATLPIFDGRTGFVHVVR